MSHRPSCSWKRFGSAAMLAVMLSSAMPAFAATPAAFPDMTHSWYRYREAVSYLQGKDSISGYPDGTFKPRETVNRAEFLKLVFRSRGAPEPVSSNCFSDVSKDDWFAPFVCAAKRRGIIQGYKIGSRFVFRPEQPVTFAEAVKMIVLAYGKDVTERSGEFWYKPYADSLDQSQILPSFSYTPGDPLTRERAADLIARFVRNEEDRTIPRFSPGCGKTSAGIPSTIQVNGVDRSFLLTKPRSYVEHDPAPLIVAFHGRTNSNEQVRAYFGLDRQATDSFIAYPAALPASPGTFSWSDPGDKAGELRDIAFFDAIVETVGQSYCIDLDRIYVVGHSLGAWMADTVACARGGVVRASATVGGASLLKNCTGPTAALLLNNPHDSLSPFADAEKMRDIRVAENSCSAGTEPMPPTSLSCVSYDGCTSNPVVWCPHTIDSDRHGTYYPHLWPDDAAETIVAFFRGLPK